MSGQVEDDADPTFTHFAHRNEFLSLLDRFLAVDLRSAPTEKEDEIESGLVTALGSILDYYLPLPGLLDPSLDDIVPPLMSVLSTNLTLLVEVESDREVNAARISRLGRVINWIVKVRGWKAVVSHFPSAIQYLTMLITLLSPPSPTALETVPKRSNQALVSGQDAWELRAVLLLWLALLLTVPFGLEALSSTETPTRLDIPTHRRLFSQPTSDLAVRVTLLALPLLHRPGKEGGYAALVLARLYAREDAVQGLDGFFQWAAAELSEGERDSEANIAASILTLLSLLPDMVVPIHLDSIRHFTEEQLIPHLTGSQTAATSGLIRKLAVKARGRWWLARLGKGFRNAVDQELPDGIEDQLDDLMSGLGDKDTIVRYSSAKYLARISELLPSDLLDQIVLATVGLFAGTDDEPVIETPYGAIVDPGGSTSSGGAMGLGGLEATRGEARWHGVCLAIAEMARRGLLGREAVDETIPWVIKALKFDLRRASHSIGSNVRDAAAYVLWSLSRASPPDELKSRATEIAAALVCVAVFDREVGVRRAASAAFQEGVGRLGLYPEGIDVLGKTDFYSVSVRRKAFSTAAPAVAIHQLYRSRMREHLHHITLRHWDAAMRVSGAVALRAMLQLGSSDVADSIRREVAEIPSLDPVSVHGALVALTQIAQLVDDNVRAELLAALSFIRPSALVTSTAAEIIQAACEFIEATLTSHGDISPIARFFDAAARQREGEVHVALAGACRRLSEVRDVSREVERSISDLNSMRASQCQAAALCLGHYRYQSTSDMKAPLNALLHLLDPAAKADVETRRNAIKSLCDLACQRDNNNMLLLDPAGFHDVVAALTLALEDYTTDQRGDVGSWVRSSSISSLTRIISAAAATNNATVLVPQALFTPAIAGIIKQAMEKLEVVRVESTRSWETLIEARADEIWVWERWAAMCDGRSVRGKEEWFSAGLELLQSPFRFSLLSGLIHTAGSQVHSSKVMGVNLYLTQSDRAFVPLARWLRSHNDELVNVVNDLVTLLASNLNGNRVFIPTLKTLTRLFESGIITAASSTIVFTSVNRAIAIAGRGVPQLKSIDRITAAMKLIVATVVLPDVGVKRKAIDAVAQFLGHRFPRIRALTSEAIYLALTAENDIDPQLEEVLLETVWTDAAGLAEAERVVAMLETTV